MNASAVRRHLGRVWPEPLIKRLELVAQMMGVTLDMTERKQAEYVLRSSEARVAAAVRAAGLGFNEADGNGSVRYILRQLSKGATP
jgi:PAS domain-containing protein